MKQDVFGQTVSLTRDATVADWSATQRAFLAHGAATPTHLARVLEAEPDFALAHAVQGLFYLLLGRRELVEPARTALATAQSAALRSGATERERHYLAALEAWLAGAPSRAVAEMERVLESDPTDPLAMKLSQAIRFVLGDAGGMRASAERLLLAYEPDHPARGYLLGCHAFALEETGAYEQAEIAGRQALWLAPDDAWGLHAVAHVHDMTGRARQGLQWLTGREEAWAHCNNFRFHVWWHKALMHLDQGEIDEVLDLYDREIRAERTDDYRDISNGVSLLMRLELEGVDVGDRWEEMAELSARRTEDGCLIFADLHYLLALARTDRQAESRRLIRRIHHDARNSADEVGVRMGVPGCDAAEGLAAFTEGRFEAAFVLLCRVMPQMQHAGGSHAQRDVFERITIDAGLRAGRVDAAELLLKERLIRRDGREDAYCATRRNLISAAREPDCSNRVSAQ